MNFESNARNYEENKKKEKSSSHLLNKNQENLMLFTFKGRISFFFQFIFKTIENNHSVLF